MINKNKFRISNDKKILHKIGKQWVTISALTIALLGGGAISTVATHADTTTQGQKQPNTAITQPSNNTGNKSIQPTSNNSKSIMSQAKQMTGNLMANAAHKANSVSSSASQSSLSASSQSASAKSASSSVSSSSSSNSASSSVKNSNSSNTQPQQKQSGNSNNQKQVKTLLSMGKPNLSTTNNAQTNSDWIYDPSTKKYLSDGQVTDWQPKQPKLSSYNGLNYRYSPSTHAVEFINGIPNKDLSNFLSYASDSDLNNPTSLKIDSDIKFNKVSDMADMFSNASNLKSLQLPNNFNTSSVTNMGNMFQNDSSLQVLALPNTFNTSKVSDMSDMFNSDTNLESLTLPNDFDTTRVIKISDGMMNMFNSDNNLTLTITSTKTKFSDDVYSDTSTKVKDLNSNLINLGDEKSHIGTFTFFDPNGQSSSNNKQPKSQDTIIINFMYNNKKVGNINMIGSDGTPDYASAPKGYNFISDNGGFITYKANGTYNLLVAPYYNGMFYKYNQANNSVEFFKGTLMPNESASSSNDDVNAESDFYKNAPSDIKKANSLIFDKNINTSKISDFSNMFASDGYLKNVVLNFATKDSDSMHKLLASDVCLQTVSLGKNFRTTSFNQNASDMNSDNDSDMFVNDDNLEQINNQSSDIHFNSKAKIPKLYLQLSSRDKNNKQYTGINSIDITNLPKGLFLTYSNPKPQVYTKTITFVNSNKNSNVTIPTNYQNKPITGVQNTSYNLKASDIPQGFALDNNSSDSIKFSNNNTASVYVHPQYDGMNYNYNKNKNRITFTNGNANTSLSDFIQNSPDIIRNAAVLSFSNKIDSSNVNDMDNMFANDIKVHRINLNMNTTNVYSMNNLFSGDTNLLRVSLGKQFDSSDADISGLFNNDNKLQNISIKTSDFKLDPSSNIGTISQSISKIYSSSSKNPYIVINENKHLPSDLNDGNSHQGNFSLIPRDSDIPSKNSTYNGLSYKYDSDNKAITFTNGTINQSSVSNFVNKINCPLFIKNAHIMTFDSDINFNNVSDMSNMLSNNPNLTEVNFETNTNNVKKMNNLFANDSKLRNVLFGYNFNTKTINSMNGMFSNDSNLKQIINASPYTTFKGNLGSLPVAQQQSHMLGATLKSSSTPSNTPRFVMYDEANSPQSDLTNLADGINHQGVFLKSLIQYPHGDNDKSVDNSMQTPYNLQPSHWPNLEQNPTAYTKAMYRNIPDAVYNPEWGPTHNSDASIHIFYTYNSDFKKTQPLQWSDMPTQYQPQSMPNRSTDNYKIIGIYDHYTGEHHTEFGSQGVIGYQLAIGAGPKYPFGNELKRFTPKNIQGYIFHPSSDEINNSFNPYNTQAYSESDGSNGFKESDRDLTSQTNPYLVSNQGGDEYILDYNPTAKGNQFNLDHDTLDITLNYENYRDTINYSYTNPKTNKTYYWNDLSSDSRNDKNVNSDYDHPFANFYNEVKNHGTFNNIPTSNKFYVTPSDKTNFLNSVDTSFQYGRNNLTIPLHLESKITIKFIDDKTHNVISTPIDLSAKSGTVFNNLDMNDYIPNGYMMVNNKVNIPSKFTFDNQTVNIPVAPKYNNVIKYIYHDNMKSGTSFQNSSDENDNSKQQQFISDVINSDNDDLRKSFNMPKNYDISPMTLSDKRGMLKYIHNLGVDTIQIPLQYDYGSIDINYIDESDGKHVPNIKLVQKKQLHNNPERIGSPFDIGPYVSNSDLPTGYKYTDMYGYTNHYESGTQTVDIIVNKVSSTIKVDYLDKSNHNKFISKAGSDTEKYGTSFDINKYLNNLPNGYEYAGITNDSSNDSSKNGKSDTNKNTDDKFDGTFFDGHNHTIDILLTKLPQGTININYVDKANHQVLAQAKPVTNQVGKQFDISNYLNDLPTGYEYSGMNGDTNYFEKGNQTINILLTKKIAPKVAKSTITINYLDKKTGQQVGDSRKDTEDVSTPFDIGNYLSIPKGYEYVGIKNTNNNDDFNGTEFDYNNHTIDILLAKEPTSKVAKSTITVNYVDGDTNKVISKAGSDTENITTPFDISKYTKNVPNGYQYVGIKNDVDSFDYDNHTVDIVLKKLTPKPVTPPNKPNNKPNTNGSNKKNHQSSGNTQPVVPATTSQSSSVQSSSASSASSSSSKASSQSSSTKPSTPKTKHTKKHSKSKPTNETTKHSYNKTNRFTHHNFHLHGLKLLHTSRGGKVIIELPQHKQVSVSYKIFNEPRLVKEALNITPNQMSTLKQTNPKLYHKLQVVQDMLGINHMSHNTQHNLRDYINGLIDAEMNMAKSAKGSHAYQAGYSNMKQLLEQKNFNHGAIAKQAIEVNHEFTGKQGKKLPQTNESHNSVVMIGLILLALSVVFSTPVIKHRNN